MAASHEVKKSTHVITIQPKQTVLTALPYGPPYSVLDFLKGEPRVLGAIQVLLALITAGIGTIFAFNYFNFSQRFPLVFFTGYPFWGAFIFIITGFLTGSNRKGKRLEQGVMASNVISSLAAVAGIILTIISFRYQHGYCQGPSIEGICVIGRVLYNGLLSVLLIISIVELSLAVTITSFRSKCWTSSNEIVFFLPLDVTQKSELPITEENAVIQFDCQEESSSDDSTANAQPVFFGGYTFFKLRASRNPLTIHHSRKSGSNIGYISSLSGSDEQHKYMSSPLKHYEREIESKNLPVILEKRTSEEFAHTEQMSDEDLQFAIEQIPEMQSQSLQAKPFPIQVFPSYSVKNLKALQPKDLPSQALVVKSLLSETPTSHVTLSHDLTSEDLPSQSISSQFTQSLNTPYQDMSSQDMLSQLQVLPTQSTLFKSSTSYVTQSYDLISPNMLSQDIPFQNTQSQGMPSQAMFSQLQVPPTPDMLFRAPVSHITRSHDLISEATRFEAYTSHSMQAFNVQHLEQKSLDHHLQNIQRQDQQFTNISYQDIQSEVNLLTQEWKYKEKHLSKKSTKQYALDQHNKGWQSSTKQPLDLPIQGQKPPRKKSLDQRIKGWLSPKRNSINKQVRVTQFADQQADDQLIRGKQSLKQKSPNGQDEGQQRREEKSPNKQAQQQRAKDLQAEEETSPKQLGEDLQSQIQKYQQPQDLGIQEWRKKDCKAQECQFEMKHSLNWESQAWQTQDLLEKEFLKRKVLYKEAQTLNAIPQHLLDQQLQDIPFQDSQYQDKKQDLQSTGIPKKDTQINTIQTRDIKLTYMKSLCPNPSDLRSEDTKPEFHHSSCQSSVQGESSTYLSNVGSEQDVQQYTSISSTLYREDSTLTSCYLKDQKQSEDSD
ncbi:membrane-spanning 4-domains subfamily A member 14 [Molossus nigricans]